MATLDQNGEEIFNKALEIADPEQRAAYLAEACQGDQWLRARIEALLKAHDKAGSFLRVAVKRPVLPIHVVDDHEVGDEIQLAAGERMPRTVGRGHVVGHRLGSPQLADVRPGEHLVVRRGLLAARLEGVVCRAAPVREAR